MWLAVDYPSRVRTVSRGFWTRRHAITYANGRRGWCPDVTGNKPDRSKI